MSLKWLFLVAALAAGIAAVARTEPPAPTASIGADSVTVAHVGFGTRFRYSLGSVGTTLVAGSVRRSVFQTEQTLSTLGKAIKETPGSDGMRAREIARKIHYSDSLAVESLYQARPIQAIKQTMEAKSLLNAVRRNLKQQI